MPVEHVNRRGERYYLLQGKTKTGKPKYYASRKPDGVPVDRVPEGYELYENPERGIVRVRKVRPSRLSPAERDNLERWARQLAGTEFVIVDVHGDSLVVHASANDHATSVAALSRILGPFGNAELETEWMGRHAHYTPMFRFTLEDESGRLFSVERWCFRGSIDGWFHLSGSQPLEKLAKEYLPHLNRQSFFELM